MNTPHKPQSHLAEQAPISYDIDFCAWTEAQASLLRSGQIDKLDFTNLAEEIESMGDNNKLSLESYLGLILSHMLKWEYQPELRRYGNSSWEQTIRRSRKAIARIVKRNPSLKGYVDEIFEEEYLDARKDAAWETRIPLSIFPETCQWSKDQVTNFDLNFFPGIPVETPPVEKKRSQKGKRKR